jgi:hypothetical protein
MPTQVIPGGSRYAEQVVIVTELFDGDEYYAGPAIDSEMVRRAEKALGVRLPSSYIAVLSQRNGGSLTRRCYPTDFSNSWATDRIGVRAILGIDGERGVDRLSTYWIAEWGYPDIGVVICDLPSGGHDTVMLDYSESGPSGERAVVYVDEDRVPRRIANSFEEFPTRLVSCDRFAVADVDGPADAD